MKYWAGGLLLMLILVQTFLKASEGLLPEMLWTCYPATFLLAIGLIFDLPLFSATGFLFHLCLGLPVFLLILFTGEKANTVSLLIHFFSPLIGIWAWRGKQLPLVSAPAAMGLILVFVTICYFFTAPEANINHAFKPWDYVISDHWNFLVFGVLENHIFNTSWMLSVLLIGRVGINWCLAKL